MEKDNRPYVPWQLVDDFMTAVLVKLGLPSRDAIMKYYEDWHEPFVFYSKLYEKIN